MAEEDATLPGLIDVVKIPRLQLHVEREGGQKADREVVLDGDLFRIGSHQSNELILDDRRVSRFHCRLVREHGKWKLLDQDSLNGTAVNGVRGKDMELPLPDCRLSLGDSIVTVRELGSVNQATVPSLPTFGSLVGNSLIMRQLFGLLNRVARSESTVLIEGESGTGKELIATELVQRGPRGKKPFIVVDCGTIAPELIESELFGHVRGAFTGAEKDRVGAFEAADGGTIFLDEIGEMPLSMQPKLLRALEAKEFKRVGETRTRKVDARVIAATNRRLEREVNHGRFREDLYFRLSVVTIRVPPLRDHVQDLPLLIEMILTSLGADQKRALFTNDVVSEMAKHDWPGNVRELRNYVERSVILESASPAPERMSVRAPSGSMTDIVDIEVPFKIAKDRLLSDFEQRYLTAVLQWSEGRVGPAARKAGLDRMYIYRLMQKYDLKKSGSIDD
jgi:DNA-binding NtrC family response regulator